MFLFISSCLKVQYFYIYIINSDFIYNNQHFYPGISFLLYFCFTLIIICPHSLEYTYSSVNIRPFCFLLCVFLFMQQIAECFLSQSHLSSVWFLSAYVMIYFIAVTWKLFNIYLARKWFGLLLSLSVLWKVNIWSKLSQICRTLKIKMLLAYFL